MRWEWSGLSTQTCGARLGAQKGSAKEMISPSELKLNGPVQRLSSGGAMVGFATEGFWRAWAYHDLRGSMENRLQKLAHRGLVPGKLYPADTGESFKDF